MSRRLAAVALSLVLVLGACGSDDGDDVTSGDDVTTTTGAGSGTTGSSADGSASGDCRTAEEARSAETPEVDAVSYTHLDVYKRQV